MTCFSHLTFLNISSDPPLIFLVWFGCFSLLFFSKMEIVLFFWFQKYSFYHAYWLLFLWGMERGGGWREAGDGLPYWCLTRKFQTGWLGLYFWERLKLQLGQLWNLGLVSLAFFFLTQVMAFWAHGFLFNKYIHTSILLWTIWEQVAYIMSFPPI